MNWEDVLAFQVRASGLDAPDRQVKFHPARRFRFDLAWPALLVYCEVDGGVWVQGRHTRGAGYIRDTEKFNEATVLGWRGLRVVPDQIKTGKALEWIKQTLALVKGKAA